ncbi:SAF domain-containing protein [Candidatus Poriferisodalis sp.]|uniref:SAF domain-containing protein n=1 Tax=Candidatus Poriferisodalis sp. TaxID=3101277 RepID=UPI003B0214D0
MTNVIREAADGPAAQQRPVAMPMGGERRRWSLVILGVVLLAGTGFGFWYVLDTVDERQLYVVAARDIAIWEPVSAADFELVEANVGQGSASTANDIRGVYGQWAAGPIPEGTFVTVGMFRPPPLSGGSEADSIGIRVALPAGEVTYGELQPGDTVALIGREPQTGLAPTAGAGTGELASPLALIGVLRIDVVQDGSLVYVVEPAVALQIQNMVERYLAASDRQIWRLGINLTADDVVRTLDGYNAASR